MTAQSPSASRGPTRDPGQRRAWQLFTACWIGFALVALWPIWSTRLLPMQDYPQHLFLSHVVATYDDPAFDWKAHYVVDRTPRPYAFWYLLMAPISTLFGTETAGKLMVSLSIALVAALVLTSARSPDAPPWGSLLLYPFAFSQVYFMGFINYVISIPILFLLILDLERLTDHATALRMVRHVLCLIILLLTHPYTALVYAGLAGSLAIFFARGRGRLRRLIAPALLLCPVFLLWYLTQPPTSSVASVPWRIRWWPIDGTLGYGALMFTGMRVTPRPDLVVVFLWSLIAAVFVLSWARHRRWICAPRWPLVALGSSTLGFLILPFWLGYYSYLNLRLAQVMYFSLALVLGRVRLSSKVGALVASLTLGLLVSSIRLQASVSREAGGGLAVLTAMRANALVLPLMFESASDALDPDFFYQIHSHEPDYYHGIVGGGANPALFPFPNGMIPVRYREGFTLPRPADPRAFRWPLYGPYYDYIVTRGAPPPFVQHLSSYCDPVARSGAWWLFRNRGPRVNPTDSGQARDQE